TAAARHLNPRVTVGAELVNHFLVALQRERIEADVLVHGHERPAALRAGQQAKRAALVRVGDGPLLVARLVAAAGGHDPDLQEVHERPLGRVELAVGHARARGHALHFARTDDRAVAEAVAVLQRALERVAQDLHYWSAH